MGIYFETSMSSFFILIFILIVMLQEKYRNKQKCKSKYKNEYKHKEDKLNIRNKTFEILNMKRYFRYFKIYIKYNIIIICIISAIVSNIYVCIINQKYEKIYRYNELEIELICEIIGLKEKNEFSYRYIVNVVNVVEVDNILDSNNLESDIKNETLNLNEWKNIKIYINIPIDIDGVGILKYGDLVKVSGEYIKPDNQRNEGGFDYSKYLKSIGIYGSVKVENLENKNINKGNVLIQEIYIIREQFKNNIMEYFDEKESGILIALILGDNSYINEETLNEYRESSLTHILAISGMHITYILIGLNYILTIIVGKKQGRYLIGIFLILYIIMTGGSPSVIRASFMAIMFILSKAIYRKNNISNTMSFSILLILVFNPYMLINLGFQLSYIGTIGIILFQKEINKYMLNKCIKEVKKRKINYSNSMLKIIEKLIDIFAVTLSAQAILLPILIYNFNTINLIVLVTNLIVSVIIPPLIIISFLAIFTSIFLIQILQILNPVINICLIILNYISQIGSLVISEIYVITPNIFEIVIYYVLLFLIYFFVKMNNKIKLSNTEVRMKNIIALLKYLYITYKSKNAKKLKYILIIVLIILLIYTLIYFKRNSELMIYFVDVGQGDCTLITTPENSNILIDGGGNLTGYDVGKNILIPYLLDKRINNIDYIFVSHFDEDHIGGIISLIKEIKVNTIFIPPLLDKKENENYQELLGISKEKNIEVIELQRGTEIGIEENIKINILWPTDNLIEENDINNNSLVFTFNYKEFSVLFTGDIEEIAEREILELDNKNELSANILKVAHHGSKTSSIEEFIEQVNPQIVIFCVGKNNNFGHPNEEVVSRFDNKNSLIYRTDLHGEIKIQINSDLKINITTQIKQ